MEGAILIVGFFVAFAWLYRGLDWLARRSEGEPRERKPRESPEERRETSAAYRLGYDMTGRITDRMGRKADQWKAERNAS